MKTGKFLAAILFFASCSSVAKQQRNAEAFYATHPEKLAWQCAVKFPPDTIFKPGTVSIRSDTTFLPGDSVPCPPVMNAAGETVSVKVKCPDSKVIHDSIFKTDTITKLSTDLLDYYGFQNDSLRRVLLITQTQKAEASKTAGNRLWFIIGLIIALGAYAFLNLKKRIT